MAKTVTGVARIGITAENKNTTDLAVGKANPELAASLTFAAGTGNDQVNKEFSDLRVVTASGTETLDLSGSLTDSLGVPVVFTAVKAIAIKAADDNVGNLTFFGGSNSFLGPLADATDKLILKPGAIALFATPDTGWTVTAGTGDLVLVANAGAADATYSIMILGIG